MTLTLHPPSVDDTRSALADWLELETLFSSRQQASKASLTGVLDFVEEEVGGEHEPDDDSIGDRILDDAKREAIVSSAFEELSYRQKTLGGWSWTTRAPRSSAPGYLPGYRDDDEEFDRKFQEAGDQIKRGPRQTTEAR